MKNLFIAVGFVITLAPIAEVLAKLPDGTLDSGAAASGRAYWFQNPGVGGECWFQHIIRCSGSGRPC